MIWIVHSDGAALPTNPGPCGWGAVIVSPSGEKRHLNGYLGLGTNQIGELTGAINGLRATPEGAEVELFSDSQYVVKGLMTWRKTWERKGWKKSDGGKPIANLELWLQLFAEYDKRRVTARWVKGHSGDVLNELADSLAEASVLSVEYIAWSRDDVRSAA